MIESIVTVVITACLSSIFTLGLAWWIWERRLESRLESRFEAKVEKLSESLGETVRNKVRQGVLEAIAEAPSLEVIGGAGRTMADSAVDLLRGGLGTILGSPADPEK